MSDCVTSIAYVTLSERFIQFNPAIAASVMRMVEVTVTVSMGARRQVQGGARGTPWILI